MGGISDLFAISIVWKEECDNSIVFNQCCTIGASAGDLPRWLDEVNVKIRRFM